MRARLAWIFFSPDRLAVRGDQRLRGFDLGYDGFLGAEAPDKWVW
ncbi:MAG: hypothetical protein WAO58_03140 [Fimbriimonadaceae bacterium]